MKDLFVQPYFWYYIAVSICSFFGQKAVQNFSGKMITFRDIMGIVSIIGMIAKYIFLVIGFFVCPTWWYPLVMFAIAIVPTFIIPPVKSVELVVGAIGIVVIPILGTLMFVDLFR